MTLPAKSAAGQLREAEALAFSDELQRYCTQQRVFIETGDGRDALRELALHLAVEARRRRIKPEGILIAMLLGGCYRSTNIDSGSLESCRRYMSALNDILVAYYKWPELTTT